MFIFPLRHKTMMFDHNFWHPHAVARLRSALSSLIGPSLIGPSLIGASLVRAASSIAITGLLLLSYGQAAMAEEDRVALVIGNGAYKSLEALPQTVADAAAVANALRELEFDVIELFDGTNGEMSADLQTFSERLKPGAVALFYFAGHAVQFQGRNFLLPASANLKGDFTILTEGIVADAVLNVMEKSGSALNLLLLDTSYRNRFVAETESLLPGMAEMTSQAPETIIVFATEPGDVIDGTSGDANPFADALVTGLSRPAVEVNGLLAELQARVSTTTAGEQRPWISTAGIDAFHLRPSEPPAADLVAIRVQPEPAPQEATEVGDPVEAVTETAALSDQNESAQNEPAEAQDDAALPAADSGDIGSETVAAATDGALEAPAEPAAAGPTGHLAELQAIEAALGTEDKKRIQAWLTRKGYYTQAVDGVFGPGTRRAIRTYQETAEAEPTGWLTVMQLYRILQGS